MFILRSNDGMAQYQICKIDTYVVYFDDALAVFHKSSRQIIFHVIFLKKKDFFAITVRHHECILVEFYDFIGPLGPSLLYVELRTWG